MLCVILQVIFIFCSTTYCNAQNSFVAKTLGSNMVLQRDISSTLYGYSFYANSEISIDFNGDLFLVESSAEPSKSGGYFWSVNLPPMHGSFDTFRINISSTSGENALLENVVFGDVFLCGGQSNMQFSLPAAFEGEKEIAKADNYPFLRIFSVGQDFAMAQYSEPQDDLHFVMLPWSVGSSKTVGDGEWSYFSAACWEFGTHLFDSSLDSKVPLGLVSNNWGGTGIQAWSPPEVMRKCKRFEVVSDVKMYPNLDKIKVFMERNTAGDVDPNVPSTLYYAMITPYKSMKIKGVLWFQGEGNVADGTYACMQDKMVTAWRNLLGQDFSFIYTQLSTWDNGGLGVLPQFRMQQATILDITNNAAMITAADLGDPESPYHEIHSRKKVEVGRRLALASSSLIYGAGSSIPHMGPLVRNVTSFKHPVFGYSARVTFDEESCGDSGLHLSEPQECPSYSAAKDGGCGFIQLEYSASSITRKTQAVLATVAVTAPNVVEFVPNEAMFSSKALNVLYCLGDYPLMTIYNSIDIPLLPTKIAIP